MAAPPRLTVFTPDGEYIAACTYAAAAAAPVSPHGDRTTIRDGHAAVSGAGTEGTTAMTQISPAALREVEAALARYQREVRASALQNLSAHTYTLHAASFVHWLNGDVTPDETLAEQVHPRTKTCTAGPALVG